MKTHALTLLATILASALACAADPPATSPPAGDSGYPKILNAEEIGKLYGEKKLAIAMQGERGDITIQAHPDGRLFGQNPMASGLKNKQASGTWRIDPAADKVCHEWQNSPWVNRCMMIRQTGPESFEYTGAPTGPGTKFTIQR